MHKKNKMIDIKQNGVSNNIFRNLNRIRNMDESNADRYNGYELFTENGKIKIESKEKLESLQMKLKYPIIKKLFLYICHLMNRENYLNVELNISKFLKLQNLAVRTENKNRVLEHLFAMQYIKVANYKFKDGKDTEYVKNSKLISIASEEPLKIKVGDWAKKLVEKENNQYSYIPKDIFRFKKFELDIAFNIFLRFINERKNAKNNDWKCPLSIKSILKNVELNIQKKGPKELIDQIEEALNKLEKSGWFTWSYRYKIREDLPIRNRLDYYQDFIVDFNLEDSLFIYEG